MANVLLVDTNFSSGPIYQYLIKAGCAVTVVGGNPGDALAKCADDYVNIDYSDLDKTRQLISDRKIDYLVPGCNDRSYMVCSEINHDGRFPGIDIFDTADVINNKERFRAFAVAHGLPAPRVLTKNEIGSRWPVIVKPVDAFSGRGVAIVREGNKFELESALTNARDASRTGVCIVEDYVEGQLYSHSAFIQKGCIIADRLVEEHGTANPFVVDTSRVVSDFPQSMLDDIRDSVSLLANKLDFQDGLVHTQFISNGTSYWLIEVTRRCPGDLYSQLIELSTGLNYAENYARPFIGQSFEMQDPGLMKLVLRHTLTQSSGYVLGSIEFNMPLMIRKWVPIGMTGDRLRASPYGRTGILFAESLDSRGFDCIWKAALSRRLYSIKDF